MAVSFDEENSSPRGSLRDGKRVVTRNGSTAWTDIDAFAAELMPPSTSPHTASVGAALPGNPFLRVSAFDFTPKGTARITGASASGINIFDKAQWAITYERPIETIDDAEATAEGDPIPFLSHTWEGGGEFLTLPTEGLLWLVAGGAIGAASSVGDDANAGLFIPTIEHQVTWHRVPNPPFNDIRARIGHVNNANVQFATGTAGPETLLFLNPSISREVMSDGARAWSVNYKFSERRVIAEDQAAIGGWNHFYRNDVSSTGFYRMQRTVPSGFKDIYTQIAFGPLFPI